MYLQGSFVGSLFDESKFLEGNKGIGKLTTFFVA